MTVVNLLVRVPLLIMIPNFLVSAGLLQSGNSRKEKCFFFFSRPGKGRGIFQQVKEIKVFFGL